MPLPGGASDKYGIRYETHWTVKCMIDVMDERADQIRIEVPREEGKGVRRCVLERFRFFDVVATPVRRWIPRY